MEQSEEGEKGQKHRSVLNYKGGECVDSNGVDLKRS